MKHKYLILMKNETFIMIFGYMIGYALFCSGILMAHLSFRILFISIPLGLLVGYCIVDIKSKPLFILSFWAAPISINVRGYINLANKLAISNDMNMLLTTLIMRYIKLLIPFIIGFVISYIISKKRLMVLNRNSEKEAN
jgi:hypothetical protein